MAEFHDVVSRPTAPIEGNGGCWDDTPDYRESVRRSPQTPDEDTLLLAGFATIGRGRVKVDLETPLEAFFWWGGIGGGIGLLIVLFDLLFESRHPMSPTTRNSLLSIFGSLTASCIALHRVTDNYYIVDLNRKALLYHFRLMFWEWESPYAGFEELLGVTTHGREKSSKHSRWWEYQTYVVLKNGSSFPVSNSLKESLLDANLKARTLANLAGCPYQPGRHGEQMNIERDQNTGKYRITHTAPWLPSGAIILFAILGATILLGMLTIILVAR